MADRPKISIKHLQIDRANRAVIAAAATSAVIVVFGIFIGRAMLMRQSHQSKVIAAKETAVTQLKANVDAKNQIVNAYQQFVSGPTNILGGNSSPNATGDRDGDNARLILDALPSKYDFPALAASVEKLFISNGFVMDGLTGTDDEINQSSVQAQSTPQVVEIPFGADIRETNYEGAQRLIALLEASIRPIKINTMSLASGSSDSIQIELELITYYQPEKALTITDQELK